MLLDTPNVKRVEYISKEQAYEQQRKKDPEAFDLLGSNPLPDTFRVTPEDPDAVLEIKSDLAPVAAGGGRTPVDGSIDEVRDRREDTTKILQVTRFVKLMAGTLGALLIAASIFLIANTIRLSLYARRREVEVMKLVGATDWFIRWPFVIEGVIVGALGTLLAILLLAVGKIAIIDPLADDFALIAAPETLPFAALVAVMLGAGIAISAIGSAVSLRRFLRSLTGREPGRYARPGRLAYGRRPTAIRCALAPSTLGSCSTRAIASSSVARRASVSSHHASSRGARKAAGPSTASTPSTVKPATASSSHSSSGWWKWALVNHSGRPSGLRCSPSVTVRATASAKTGSASARARIPSNVEA